MSGLFASLTAAMFLAAPAPEGARAVVQSLNAGLEGVLRQASRLDYRQRYEGLAPALDAAFDFDLMARQSLGRQWGKLAPADQRRWAEAFRDLTIATYASRFDRSAGQTFETLGVEGAAHDTVMVRSRVVEPGAEAVDLTYRLRQSDGAWKVIDVYLKGSVSEVALRRAEYSSVLKREGFEALLAAVSRRIDQLATATPSR